MKSCLAIEILELVESWQNYPCLIQSHRNYPLTRSVLTNDIWVYLSGRGASLNIQITYPLPKFDLFKFEGSVQIGATKKQSGTEILNQSMSNIWFEVVKYMFCFI